MKFLLNCYGPLIPHSFSAKCIKQKRQIYTNYKTSVPQQKLLHPGIDFQRTMKGLPKGRFSLFFHSLLYSIFLFFSDSPFPLALFSYYFSLFFTSSQHQAEYEVCASASLSEFTIGALGVIAFIVILPAIFQIRSGIFNISCQLHIFSYISFFSSILQILNRKGVFNYFL